MDAAADTFKESGKDEGDDEQAAQDGGTQADLDRGTDHSGAGSVHAEDKAGADSGGDHAGVHQQPDTLRAIFTKQASGRASEFEENHYADCGFEEFAAPVNVEVGFGGTGTMDYVERDGLRDLLGKQEGEPGEGTVAMAQKHYAHQGEIAEEADRPVPCLPAA